MELSYKIIILDKPWINQKNDVIELPKDEYSIFVNKENSLVVFTVSNQLQDPKTIFELTDKVISSIQEISNIKLIVSSEDIYHKKEKMTIAYTELLQTKR